MPTAKKASSTQRPARAKSTDREPELDSDVTDLERWAAAAVWSHRAELDAVETALWRSERHPALSATSCILIMLDSEPEWERFRAATEWGTALVRRLRQRILEPALPTTNPIWVDDEHFTLDYHLRRQPVGGSGSLADTLTVAQQIAMTPFDRTRPLWEGVLLTGLADGGAAYLLKIHHTLADGLGTVQLLSLLQSRTRTHTSDKPTAPTAPAGSPDDAVALATSGLLHDLSSLPARAGVAVRHGLFAARHPRTVVAETLRYAASVRRLASPPPTSGSPLLEDRDGRSWNFLALDVPLAELRAAGRTVGGSLQDAFIAALLGGIRKYHNYHDLAVEDLPISLRVSLDRADDPMSGNRFAGAMIAAPAGLVDPADRIAAVRGEVLSLHTERALDAFRAFAPVANVLPSDVTTFALQSGAAADLSAAVIPGPARESFMAGARVNGMYAFGPLPGVAISATLLTCGDTAYVGLNVDGLAVPDLDELRLFLIEGFDEVLALAR
ncbi:MAG: wax ester/triacylglycerol synthase domain-containing protein [Nocardioides sp.]|jgi:diacylglycerol O-acyltransferase